MIAIRRTRPAESQRGTTAILALWLVAQPNPGQFDRYRTGPSIARLTDPMITHHRAVVVGCRRQADVARDFPAILEPSIEYLCREYAGGFAARLREISASLLAIGWF
jgi:hypothetical protein